MSTWRYQKIPPDAYKTSKDFPFRIGLLKWLGKHSWLPRGHDALLRATFNPDGGAHFFFDIDFFGLRYRGDLGHYLDWLVFCYGGAPVCELSLLRDLTRYLRANGRDKISFYDVGANIGHHSLFMSPLVDDVFAFEPFLDLINLIEDKIELNRLTNVRILPFALGEHDSRIDYFPGLGANPGAGSLIQGFPGVSRESVPVEIRNGDDLLDKNNLPRIDLLKLDVQGFEPNVLRGLARRIRSDRPVVLAEMTDESRAGFGTASDFRKTFYDDALFAEVTGRNGRSYQLKPFEYENSAEVLVLPPEFASFLTGKI